LPTIGAGLKNCHSSFLSRSYSMCWRIRQSWCSMWYGSRFYETSYCCSVESRVFCWYFRERYLQINRIAISFFWGLCPYCFKKKCWKVKNCELELTPHCVRCSNRFYHMNLYFSKEMLYNKCDCKEINKTS
jgi:hypothetical protein